MEHVYKCWPVHRIVGALTIIIASIGLAMPVQAQEPTKVLVGFPAGSGLDVITRIILEQVSKDSGQAFVVDNRGGSGGRIAAEATARSPADGKTILAAPIVTTAFSPFVFKRVGYDALADLTPITRLGTFRFALAVNKDVPANNLAEFIAYVKANPGKINYASLSAGTPSHFLGAMFNRATGLDMQHVPYRGSGPAVQGVLAGDVHATFNTTAALMPLYSDKQLKLLAVTGRERSSTSPDVPTFREANLGLRDMEEAEMWYGFFAPGGLAQPVLADLHAGLAKALNSPAVRTRLRDLDIEVVVDTPEEFATIVRADYERWGRIIKDTGFTLNE